MDEKYWDAVARDYDGEIFDSLASDRNGIILGQIDRIGKPGGTAFDFGCGIGKYIPALAQRFRKVHAADLSAECIRRAKAAHGGLKNVAFYKGDLSGAAAEVGPVDFVLCANVLIMSSDPVRARILKRLAGLIRRGGSLLLLVPSLESSLYAHARRLEWLRRSRARPRVPAPTTLTGAAGRDVLNGILGIDGVRTKHYLKEELQVLLRAAGFDVAAVEKAEYAWDTEFAHPPRWMRDPYPWDWLAVGRKT